MPDIASAVTAIAAITAIVRELKDNHTQAKIDHAVIEVQGKLLDLQGKLISAQIEYTNALSAMKEAQEKLASLEQWGKQIERYQLKEIAPGCFAYELRQDRANGDPIHLLCSACVLEKKASILQRSRGGADVILDCLRNRDHMVSFRTGNEGFLVVGD